MAPAALMVGLLMEEAERVRTAAVAYSCKLRFVDRRNPMSGSSAPASTIFILFL